MPEVQVCHYSTESKRFKILGRLFQINGPFDLKSPVGNVLTGLELVLLFIVFRSKTNFEGTA
jgi:hypothetical protein